MDLLDRWLVCGRENLEFWNQFHFLIPTHYVRAANGTDVHLSIIILHQITASAQATTWLKWVGGWRPVTKITLICQNAVHQHSDSNPGQVHWCRLDVSGSGACLDVSMSSHSNSFGEKSEQPCDGSNCGQNCVKNGALEARELSLSSKKINLPPMKALQPLRCVDSRRAIEWKDPRLVIAHAKWTLV